MPRDPGGGEVFPGPKYDHSKVSTPTYSGLSYVSEGNSVEYAREGWTAQYLAHEHWYMCEVCWRPYPKSKTTRNTLTAAQHGKRVCFRCLDKPGRDDLLELANQIRESIQARESESLNKEP